MLDFGKLASEYCARLAHERVIDSRGYLSEVQSLSNADVEAKMRLGCKMVGEVEVVSVQPVSGSSVAMLVEHSPQAKPFNITDVHWSKRKSKNLYASMKIASRIFHNLGLSHKVLRYKLSRQDPFFPLFDETGAEVYKILKAAFDAVDPAQFREKMQSNKDEMRRDRILNFKCSLTDSIKSLLKEGISPEEVQLVLNEALVESVYDA